MKTILYVLGILYAAIGLYAIAKLEKSIIGNSDATIVILLYFGSLSFLFIIVGNIYEKIVSFEKYLISNGFLSETTFMGKKLNDLKTQINIETDVSEPADNPTQNALDVTCLNCKTTLTLDKEDLESDTFVCPVCKTINPLSP